MEINETYKLTINGYDMNGYGVAKLDNRVIFVEKAMDGEVVIAKITNVHKKYAFAADYIRLYALATEGGIYLDSDVEVIKPFAELMDLPYFICKENSPKGMEAAIIGAERDTQWVRTCLDYYHDKHFVNSDGTMNTDVLPEILKKRLEDNYELKYISSVSDFDYDKKVVSVLPSDYFSPKNYVTKKIKITRNTRTIHHFAGSWQPAWKKVLLRLWVPFSVKFPELAKVIKRNIR